jgi:hypothetical protein
MIVSTSGGGSSLSVPGSSLTNNIPVNPGTVVTLQMSSSSSFGSSTVATVTVSNTQSGVLPSKSYITNWTINTVQDSTPASVTLTASPTSVAPGETVTLTWTSVNASEVTASSGFTATSVSGTTPVTPTTTGTQSYSISVRPNPAAANFPTPVSAFASVAVTEDTTPNSFSLSPSSFTDQDKNFEVSATTSVSGLGQNVTVSASTSGSASGFSVNGGSRVTQQQIRNGDSIRVFMTTSGNQNTTVTGTLNIGTQSSSFTAATKACSATPTTTSPASGVTLNFISAEIKNQNGTTTTGVNLYTSRTGSSLFQECKPGTAGATDYKSTVSTLDVPLPAGVTQIEVAAVGSGGQGDTGKGGGGGAFARATFTAPTITGGQTINLSGTGSGATIKLNSSTTLLTAGAGTRGLLGGQGGTFSVSPLASGSTGQNGSEGSVAGGPAGGGGAAGNQAGSGQFIGGGGGGGKVLTSEPGGGIKESSIGGQNAGTAGGSTSPSSGAKSGGGGGAAANQLNPVTKKVGPGSPTGGGSGIAVVFYSAQASPGTTWDQLIQRIVSTYLNSSNGLNRPPTDTELTSRINDFRNTSSLTLDGLEQQIKNSLSSQTKATSYTDSCLTPFTPS